tara:strand:- start:2 stop:259 length:258 start_codon:yes stop_codon:yes gene_type:complete
MNSETREIIDGYIRQAGAVSKCPYCSTYDVWADDPEAETMVYAMATNGWKNGKFRGEGREAIMAAVKSALDDVNIDCPGCSGAMR